MNTTTIERYEQGMRNTERRLAVAMNDMLFGLGKHDPDIEELAEFVAANGIMSMSRAEFDDYFVTVVGRIAEQRGMNMKDATNNLLDLMGDFATERKTGS